MATRRNEEVVRAFMREDRDYRWSGTCQSHTRNLTHGGDRLINYSTTLAEWHGGMLFVNTTRYSRSTSDIQRYINLHIRLAHIPEDKIIYMDDVPINTMVLSVRHSIKYPKAL